MSSAPEFPDFDRNAAQLMDLIRDTVRRAVDLVGSQEKLAELLDYGSQSSISKILVGTQRLPLDKADMLDAFLAEQEQRDGARGGIARGASPWSVRELVDALRRAETLERNKGTDVFIASPMSVSKDYEGRERRLAMNLVKALESLDLTTYYAGRLIKKRSQFDDYDIAYRANLEHIKNSREFMLFVPGDPPPDQLAPSSVWIELGMALARNVRCTIWAPGPDHLPWVVRQAIHERATTVLMVKYYDKDPKQPARWIRQHGKEYFRGIK